MKKCSIDSSEKETLDFYIRLNFTYAVRNKGSHYVRFYNKKPWREGTTWNSSGAFVTSDRDTFKQVKWKDEPIKLLELRKTYE